MKGEPFRGSFFKGSVQVPAHGSRQAEAPRPPVKVERVKKQRAGKNEEDAQMQRARRRDGYCRFPGCKCKDFRGVLDVAHLEHRGAGGNPKRDRTQPRKLILLCRFRHRINAVSLDRKTVRIRPLDAREGTNGPCAFDVDARAWGGRASDRRRPAWFELARESARHVFEAFTPEQNEILERLKGMEL